MYKNFSRVLFLVFIAFLLSCKNNNSPSTPEVKQQVASKKEQPLKLGLLLPMSGPLAFFGEGILHSIDLTFKKRPQITKEIKIFVEDTAYDNKKAISAYQKLVKVNQVDVLYSFGGPMLNTLSPIAEKDKIPFYATESETKDCANKKYCILFRNSKLEWGQASWNLLRQQNHKKIVIVKNQNNFMDTFVEGIINAKNEDEDVQIAIDTSPATDNFNTLISKLNDYDYDAIGVFLLPTSHKAFLKALDLKKLKPKLFGVEEFMYKETNQHHDLVYEQATAIVPHLSAEFITAIKNSIGDSAGIYYGAAAHDFIDLLFDSLQSNKTVRGLQLIEQLKFNGTRTGASGTYQVKTDPVTQVVYYSFPISAYKITRDGNKLIDTYNF